MRDSRRRRMMFRDEVEEVSSIEPETDEPKESEDSTKHPAYTEGARVENQPKMIDYVPTKVFLVSGIFLMLAAVIGLLNFAHFRILPFAHAQGISAAGLELSLDRGLLSWVASFLMLATAFFCFQVFQVRRFRADDFNGSYRVWAWLALGFMLASIDATAKISPIIASLIAANWESGWLSFDRNVWLLLVGSPALIVSVRLVLEIWRSRVAIGSIAIAIMAYVIANVVRLDFLPIPDENQSVVEANTVMVAHSFLFFTILCYARFVLLESQGLIAAPVDAGKSKSRENASDEPALSVKREKDRRLESAASREADGEDEEFETEAEDEAPTLKLMGQGVQGRKSGRKKKNFHSARRRAA